MNFMIMDLDYRPVCREFDVLDICSWSCFAKKKLAIVLRSNFGLGEFCNKIFDEFDIFGE